MFQFRFANMNISISYQILFKTSKDDLEQTALRSNHGQVTHLICYFLPQTLIIDYTFFSRAY